MLWLKNFLKSWQTWLLLAAICIATAQDQADAVTKLALACLAFCCMLISVIVANAFRKD